MVPNVFSEQMIRHLREEHSRDKQVYTKGCLGSDEATQRRLNAPVWWMVFLRPSAQLQLHESPESTTICPALECGTDSFWNLVDLFLLLGHSFQPCLPHGSSPFQVNLHYSTHPRSASKQYQVLDQVCLRTGTQENQIRLWISKYLLQYRITLPKCVTKVFNKCYMKKRTLWSNKFEIHYIKRSQVDFFTVVFPRLKYTIGSYDSPRDVVLLKLTRPC